MALLVQVIDTTSGAEVKRAVAYPGWVDQSFSGGTTVYTLAQAFTAASVVEVWVQGLQQEQTAFTTTPGGAGAGTVTLSEAPNSLATVRIRVWLH